MQGPICTDGVEGRRRSFVLAHRKLLHSLNSCFERGRKLFPFSLVGPHDVSNFSLARANSQIAKRIWEGSPFTIPMIRERMGADSRVRRDHPSCSTLGSSGVMTVLG
jgi:hypothetical protein